MACTSAKAMRWVNEIFPGFPAAWRAWLSPRRFCFQHADGQHPEVVAVGTVRLSFMLATSLAAGPLMAEAPGGSVVVVGEAVGEAGPPAAVARAGADGGRDGGPRCGGAVAVRPLADDPALEQAAPLGTNGGGIPEKLLVHDLGKAGVRRFKHVRVHESTVPAIDVHGEPDPGQ